MPRPQVVLPVVPHPQVVLPVVPLPRAAPRPRQDHHRKIEHLSRPMSRSNRQPHPRGSRHRRHHRESRPRPLHPEEPLLPAAQVARGARVGREQHRLAHRRLKLLPAAQVARGAKEARVVKVGKGSSAPQPERRRGRVRLTVHLPGHRRRKGNRLRPRQGWLPDRPGGRHRPEDPRLQVLAAKAGRAIRLPAALRRRDSAGRARRAAAGGGR